MDKKPYIKILLYSMSLIVLAGINIFVNKKNGQDITSGFLVMLVATIPVIYSLIPLINDLLLLASRGKNHLTSELFTDRRQDLIHLLTILESQDHRIEIKGDEENCGKTWLAMRLCDYINSPNDKSLGIPKIKLPYKRAFFVDMQITDENNLNNFFNSNIITPKDVIIFDHVEDIEKLISKQKYYHFQMVYVMKYSSEISFSSHNISKFNIEDMGTLHDKIRNTYPNLDQLTQKEFDKLFELTNGNVGRISGILSEQKCIKWLKDIAQGAKTEYDIALDKIQIELFIGHYKHADKKLKEFNSNYSNAMKKIMDIQYKYWLILSDCQHLLNNYSDALCTLSLIEATDYHIYNKNHEIELHKAHYLKHLWNCDKALNILYYIKSESYSAIVDSLGILAAKYFINDLHVDFSDKNSINVYKDYYICAESSVLKHTQADAYKLMRHKAIYEYYTHSNSNLKKLLFYANQIIAIYSAENNRLLANAYFIQGELYRLHKNFTQAIISYKKCLGITHDNNIVIQVNLMVYYLKNIKKLSLDFNIINDQKIIELCEHNNYANKIYHRIKCIELNDPNAKDVIDCFDSRIMPIL